MSHSDICKHGYAIWCDECDGTPDLMAALEDSLRAATCSSWRVHGTPICLRCTECGYGFHSIQPIPSGPGITLP